MYEKRMAELLTAYSEGQINRSESAHQVPMTDEEHGRLAPLFQLAERLQQGMPPVQPPGGFVRDLGQDLVKKARRRIALSKRLRRLALIGVAALGSLLSIASVVGAVVFVIARLRARAQARAIQAPTG
jgi:hypothetical protein